jgi:PPK2 family polyphosphate:nucleotide phosphotransferase
MPYSVQVEPGKRVKLGKINPAEDSGLSKSEGKQRMAELRDRLADLQQDLYAAGVNSVLIVLQGMDTSGKDGTVRKVLSALNPQGCEVTSFKQPNSVELAHDFLWRVHRRAPAKGTIGVFNRSHYEDVLIVRVHELVPPKTWKDRYQRINHFEELLHANGTIICKFFLHISKDEQRERLLAREQDVEKAYKLSPDDWKERERWDQYITAYEDALSRCGTPDAPWTVVPADRKWHRNLAVAQVLVDRLEEHRKSWRAKLREMNRERLAELAKFHADEELAASASGDGQHRPPDEAAEAAPADVAAPA